jgi:outer membrane protein insertion porin family
MRLRILILTACLLGAGRPGAVLAQGTVSLDQLIGARVVSVRVVSQGVDVHDPQVDSLLTIEPGKPLTAEAARRTVVKLMALGTYTDVRVSGVARADGLTVEVELVPLREVGQIVFKGDPGIPERLLREAITRRFGTQPPIGRVADVATTLEDVYRENGFLRAKVLPRPFDDASAGPLDLVFDLEPGTRARLRRVEVKGEPDDAVARVAAALDLRTGSAYEPAALRARLATQTDVLKASSYLEARIEQLARVSDTGQDVDLSITVTRGPLVTLAFAGDPLPARDRESLVPIAREGSADEDFLEDSQVRIEQWLRGLGYRDARAPFTRRETDGRLTVVFTVTRGPLYRVSGVTVESGSGPAPALLLGMKPGEPFVQARLQSDVAAVVADFRKRGYTRAVVTPVVTPVRAEGARDVPVMIAFQVDEGPRALVSAVSFDGADVLPEDVLAMGLETRTGQAYYKPFVEADRERVLAQYRNRGYREAAVDGVVSLSQAGDAADVRFVIHEGPQILVDHILVVGNTRTSETTIRRELTLKPGGALGDAAVAESQRRLAALGVFRRSTISELAHTSQNLRDVLVTVEEAPATSMGYGGGFEFQKVESSEFAPRGFMEIGRRNLWGKNRSVNLFGRLSLRRQSNTGTTPGDDGSDTNLEYRVIGSYREPRVFGTRGDLQMATVFEQGSRTSFRYRHRSARMDLVERRGAHWSFINQFTVKRNEIFDDRIAAADRPLIDRLFPQVRLSSLSSTAARDTRSDPLDPVAGQLLSFSGETALRQLGSQIGYAKTFLQAFAYHRIPFVPRLVFAGGARLGLGTGFRRTVQVTAPDGSVSKTTFRDLPASERFFGGGDTTVRGFRLDHLGTAAVFDSDGTPIGGHALIIVNTEGRLTVWKDLGVVGFLDLGNVYATVNDVDPSSIRAGSGFGLRYKSPIGPLRMDFGWKLGTLRTFGTAHEDRFALHISIGQAF